MSERPRPAPISSEAHHRLLDLLGAAGAEPKLASAAEGAWLEFRELQAALDREVQRNIELSLAVDSAQIGAWIWRSAGATPELESAQGVVPLLGEPPWDGTWRGLLSRVSEEDRPAVEQAFARGLGGETEFQVQGPGGERRWLMARGQTLPGDERLVLMAGTLEDVTDRRAMQEQLRDAEARYRTLVEQLPAIVYIVKLDRLGRGRTTYISPQVEQILGYSAEEWLADPELWWRIVAEDQRERVRAEVRRKDEEPGSSQRLHQEYLVRARDGRPVWLRNESMTAWSRDGRTRYTDGVMVDVTETRAREERLRLLQQAFAALPLGVAVSSPEGRILFVNDAEAAAHGYAAPADLEGQPVELLGNPPVPPEGGTPSFQELPRRHRDGSLYRARVWTRAVSGADGERLAVVTVTDFVAGRE
jgi:PAS domain S-box-containing protein